jgi:hypothetical protein
MVQRVTTPSNRIRLLGAFLAFAVYAAGCSDVGDNSNIPMNQDAGLDATTSPGLDGELDSAMPAPVPDSSGTDAGMPSNGDAGMQEDTGSQPMDGPNTGNDVISPLDSSMPDAQGVDAGPDSTAADTGTPEAAAPDAGMDSTVVDTGAPESSTPDAAMDGGVDSTVDASNNETGSDSGPDATVDAGPDAGIDTGIDAGTDGSTDTGGPDAPIDAGGPTPCTMAPCAAHGPNSVLCDGNTMHNNVCTPTEALYVERDIAKGYLTAAGQLDPSTSCYECMMSNGGLNDDLVPTDKGNECGDVPSTAKTLTGETGVQACLDTLTCMIAQACDTASPPSFCFCGAGGAGTACLTAGAANGPCLQNEIDGLDIGTGTVLGSLVEGDPTATQKAYTNKALGSGMANSIGGFAFSNCPMQCTP